MRTLPACSKSLTSTVPNVASFCRTAEQTSISVRLKMTDGDAVMQHGRCLASRLPRGRKFRCLGLLTAGSVFHWLASASEKLPLPRLGLTVSVSPWYTSALARLDSGSPSSDSHTKSILVTYFHVHSFRSIIAFYQQSIFYIQWFLYGILVPTLPRHYLGLLLPHLEH